MNWPFFWFAGATPDTNFGIYFLALTLTLLNVLVVIVGTCYTPRTPKNSK